MQDVLSVSIGLFVQWFMFLNDYGNGRFEVEMFLVTTRLASRGLECLTCVSP